jgi:hypothetical protein
VFVPSSYGPIATASRTLSPPLIDVPIASTKSS